MNTAFLTSVLRAVEDACFKDENRLYAKFISLVARSFMWTPLEGLDSAVAEMIVEYSKEHKTECSSDDFEFFISSICHQNSKPIVLVIDEVDQAGNHPSFRPNCQTGADAEKLYE